ncbi:LrgB family protein [Ornithinibacillus sp. 4-3]|uniref:LrgB family protein n=1 Tax=Ornithinibacillus sp. 4-3 TaxID=3231488 RepID=A0AB39HQD7_9BACI
MVFVITIFSIIATIGMYLLALKAHKKYPILLMTPIFFATTSIIIILLVMGISYEEYTLAKDIMTYLLGPATVALAIPLYRQRHVIMRNFMPVILGMIIGTTATIVATVYMATWIGLSEEMVTALSIKTITVPIASEVAVVIGADASFVAIMVVLTGMFGAMFGSVLLNWARITDPVARGLSFGTISHGIGTAQAMVEGEIEGATSGVAIGLTGVFTSLIIPWLLPLLV